jgi:hypothetical protein
MNGQMNGQMMNWQMNGQILNGQEMMNGSEASDGPHQHPLFLDDLAADVSRRW